jgi:hypothetical protein
MHLHGSGALTAEGGALAVIGSAFGAGDGSTSCSPRELATNGGTASARRCALRKQQHHPTPTTPSRWEGWVLRPAGGSSQGPTL